MDYTKIQLPGEERKRTFARLMAHAIAPDGGFCGNDTTALNALDIAFKTRIPNLLKPH